MASNIENITISCNCDSREKTFEYIINNIQKQFNSATDFFEVSPCQSKIKMKLFSTMVNEIVCIRIDRVGVSEEVLWVCVHIDNYRTLKIRCVDFTNFICIRKNVFSRIENSTSRVFRGKITIEGCICLPKSDKSAKRDSVLTSLQSDFKAELLKKRYTDVVLKVGNTQFPAHKFVLSARSPVFRKMFEDRKEESEQYIKVTDVKATAMKNFLMFLYSGTLDHEKCDKTLDLYTVAVKYEVQSLVKVCRRRLVKLISKDTVLDILELAELHKEDSLKEDALEFVYNHYADIKPEKGWDCFLSEKPRLGYLILNKFYTLYNSPAPITK